MNEICVSGIRFQAKHGCHSEERKTGGDFVVDISLFGDFTSAAQSDDINDATDYVRVMDITSTIMKEPVNLIETVCQTIAQQLLAEFKIVERVSVTVKKLSPPVAYQLNFVSATITLDR
ncbi:MAG: dihydroneopterin aldolase [Salibacteraceae bacterium]